MVCLLIKNENENENEGMSMNDLSIWKESQSGGPHLKLGMISRVSILIERGENENLIP